MEPLLKVELVGFYELHASKRRNGFIEGTAHVYVIDEDIDGRGIFFSHRIKDSKSIVSLPHQVQVDEEGNKVRFPCFTFCDRKKTEFLLQETKRLVTEELKKEGRI